MLIKYAACFALLPVLLSSAPAADWPQWRGGNRDDLSPETGLLQPWPAGGPKLAWKATGLGAGYSGIALVQGTIFTMGDVEGASQLLALSAADGKRLWSAKLGATGGGGGYAGTRGTPTVDSGRVYVLNQFGDLVCAEAASGQEVWRKNLCRDFGGQLPGWGYAESPLVDGDKVFCTPGGAKGAIVALNKKTGALLWQTKDFTDNAHYSSLIMATVEGVRQIIQLTAESVVGVAVVDGAVLWRAARKGQVAVVPTPIYADNQVFVTSGYGVGCTAFRISKAAGGFQAELAYANKDLVNHHGGVILLNGFLYGHSDSKGWVCMNFKTGAVAWANPGVGKGSIAYADGHFYLRSEAGAGTLALIAASPQAYTEQGRCDQPDRSDKHSWTHPVISNGKLFIRDQDVLLCYELKKP